MARHGPLHARSAAHATTRGPLPTWRPSGPNANASTTPAPKERPTDALEARATRLEQTVRRRLLQERGSGETAVTLDVSSLLEALAEDDTVLVELAELDGVLHALVAGRGRVRHRVVGDAAAAAAAVDFSLFTLRQAARGRRAQLEVAGARLERALLGARWTEWGSRASSYPAPPRCRACRGDCCLRSPTGRSPARRPPACGCGRDRRGPRTTVA